MPLHNLQTYPVRRQRAAQVGVVAQRQLLQDLKGAGLCPTRRQPAGQVVAVQRAASRQTRGAGQG